LPTDSACLLCLASASFLPCVCLAWRSFDGVEIGSDGTVPFRSGERISFTYLISQKYTGDEVGAGLGWWVVGGGVPMVLLVWLVIGAVVIGRRRAR
jgi:hypothetical protein